jgi:hypothetical protein
MRVLDMGLIIFAVVIAGKRSSCFYMFEHLLAQVHFLCLYFFSVIFDDYLYTIHGLRS